MKLYLFIIIASVFITACSTTSAPSGDWPAQLPPKSYFQAYYTKDPKHQQVAPEDRYLLWIKRFYLGWELYDHGWIKASQELIDTLPNENNKQVALEKTLLIGKLASAEWAKDNCCRVINTRHISIWGNSMRRSMSEKNQLTVLGKILIDTQNLLSGTIKPEDIQADRYFTPKPFAVEVSNDF